MRYNTIKYKQVIYVKVYSPAEAASLLKIKTATLRKYSLLLETYGYNIERNSKKHRYYRDKDIITIRNVITGSDSGVTLEESVKNVVYLEGDNDESNVINNGKETNYNDIKELKKMILKQNDLIYNLTKKLDDQQTYINQKVDKRIEAPKEKIEGILAEHKVKVRLEEEALILWENKPAKERMKSIGWFRVEEDLEKRKVFVKNYINKNFEAYLKQELDLI